MLHITAMITCACNLYRRKWARIGNPIFPLCTANASQADKKQARKDRHVTVPKKVTSSPTCHSMRARALPGPQTHPTNSPHVPIKAKIVINGSAQVNCRRKCFLPMTFLNPGQEQCRQDQTHRAHSPAGRGVSLARSQPGIISGIQKSLVRKQAKRKFFLVKNSYLIA